MSELDISLQTTANLFKHIISQSKGPFTHSERVAASGNAWKGMH